ncbi:glutamine-hydrolyzing carbamoyl-phosphate synthase small subunit [Clostridium sp. SYSU_GA19001]|uniref:glutamine-hydrolyzing carbamoyl-phosphate synthase small subunit n=1 Tax=Clostridium caldaquaticum TaxID=2940653 RepID=UPI00207773F2|nr:glutamine-hydrolyzing carbamoyl-phosphate synthase small subunit [Clostridium caldaquaticum]MCM8711982.1 glutamine-hydrolyzing carbamoyl-phosphate synthase small subunit [Clostridium caldaquaticum]
MKARLVLEDGTVFMGNSFGAQGEALGEVVFNTCMTGYEEILTDPSYKGQMVTMTYPLIGNYGFNNIDKESFKPHVNGFIVKEICAAHSNWRGEISPEDYFKEYNIIGIKDIDTRRLTKHIRKFGSMNGIISTKDEGIEDLVKKIREKAAVKINPVKEVSTIKKYHIEGKGKKIAVLDFGVKQNILRLLQDRDCDLHVFPYDTSFEEVLKINPDGILLSNGPGDPEDLPEAAENIKKLLGKKPIMGICLGHQLLGIALGGKTYKLKFGHHGGNHPVKDYTTGRIYITSQNHNYALKNGFSDDVVITHINVNDNTVEGFRHKSLPVISVQYHPEAAPGPQDSNYVFDDFMKMVGGNSNA